MKKTTYIIAFISLVLISVYMGINLYNKPHVDVIKSKAKFSLSAKELLHEYSSDEDFSNKKFANQIIRVTGKILKISTLKGKGIITLVGNDSNVICHLSESENTKLLGLDKNETITIKGQCSGFLLDVMMINCIIENK